MNKTKLITCLSFISLALLPKAFTQTGQQSTSLSGKFYLQLGTGYSFALPGQKIDQEGNILNGSVHGPVGSTQYDLKNASYTAGVPLVINCGYMLSRNIGVETDVNINLAPRSYKAADIDEYTSATNGAYDYMVTRKDKASVLLIPSLLIQSNPARLNLFMKMGIALPFNTGIKMSETFAFQNGNTEVLEWNITNYFSIGFTATAGIKYKLGNNWSLFVEASMLYLSLSRKERNMSGAELNNVNYSVSQLSGVKTYHYTKNGVQDSYGNEDALPQPFGNLSLKAGISLALHAGSHKKHRAQ